ncbi:MAG: hypothetical protein ACREJN_21590 [Nitrospiraceae bacterium]
MGISYTSLWKGHLRYVYTQFGPIIPAHLSLLKKLLTYENKYNQVIKLYTRHPKRWNRLRLAQRGKMVPLKPFPIPGDPNYKEPMEFLAAETAARRAHRKVTKTRDSYLRSKERERYTRWYATLTSTMARKAAQGWDWHEARSKKYLGRPYYNMGHARAAAQGIDIEEIPKRRKRKNLSKAINRIIRKGE